MTDKPQVLGAFDAADMIAYVRGIAPSHINGLEAIRDGRTVVVPADELIALKVARAKLDDEAYQRGYADAIKHDAGRETLTGEDLERVADMLDSYANLMCEKVPAAEIERWHYPPEVEGYAGKLRALAGGGT